VLRLLSIRCAKTAIYSFSCLQAVSLFQSVFIYSSEIVSLPNVGRVSLVKSLAEWVVLATEPKFAVFELINYLCIDYWFVNNSRSPYKADFLFYFVTAFNVCQ